MKNNVGKADRIARIVIAAVLATLYFMGIVSGTLGIALVVFAAILVLTTLIGFCPIYMVLGINTCGVPTKPKS